MTAYNDFVVKYEGGMTIMEIVAESDISRRTAYRYKAYYDKLKDAGKNLLYDKFKPVEFDGFKSEAGLHAFTMSPTKWIEGVNAIGIVSKAGRYGGTYAHSDIALEFASWVSAEFKLYIMKDYQRLKKDENSRLSLNWNLNREIAKLNYKIHTDAIKENLIPPELTMEQISYKYANEADLLNVALFGETAKQWREKNPEIKGNIRDEANLNQLLVLANMESYNSILIEQGTIY